tara:strand:+ start:125 stop:733 length:609 start_codon:yes stop_codon:yes gene_type:complete
MNVIQAANNKGRGGIYLIKNFDQSVARKLSYLRDVRDANRFAPNKNLSNIRSFHFDESGRIKTPQPRIIYNPTTNPTVKGTPLLKRKPTKENRNFVLSRRSYPNGNNGNFDEIYKVLSTGNSQLMFPDLKPGEALYFEGNYTFHGIPSRQHTIHIFAPGLGAKMVLTPNNLVGKVTSPNPNRKRASSPNSPPNRSKAARKTK